jgi:hypothetical protein
MANSDVDVLGCVCDSLINHTSSNFKGYHRELCRNLKTFVMSAKKSVRFLRQLCWKSSAWNLWVLSKQRFERANPQVKEEPQGAIASASMTEEPLVGSHR